MRRYLNAIIAVVLLAGIGWSHWKAYSGGKGVVQAKFDEYKESINDQVQKANAKAAQIKADQDAKFTKAQSDYSATRKQLDAALARLRKPQAMPGNESLPVAGCSSDSVSTETADTAGTAPAVEIAAGIRQTSFYANAMSDVLQCSRLIDFLHTTNQ